MCGKMRYISDNREVFEMSKVVTMDQAVAMFKPGSFVITSGFLTAGTPDCNHESSRGIF